MNDDERWPAFLSDSEDDPPPRRTSGSSETGAPQRRPRRPLARATHAFGELLLTVGAVLLLFVGYTLWWTGVETGNEQDALRNQLIDDWETGDPQAGESIAPGTSPTAEEPPGSTGLARPDIGDGLAVLRIPRFGADFAWVVVEGVDLDNLARGPGHYPDSALPGEVGNFAVAGHRATHGEPFAQFEALEDGDSVVVETANEWFTYQIVDIQYPVPIASGWALDPNPLELGNPPTKPMMTMTTCHPRWASTFRFLVFSELVETTPKVDAAGAEQLPPALQALDG